MRVARQREHEVADQDEVLDLVRRAQAANARAFSDLVRLLEASLMRHAFYLTGHRHQAEDLLQETLVEAWRKIARFNGQARFSTWVCSIMLHRHYDWLRKVRPALWVDWSRAEQHLKANGMDDRDDPGQHAEQNERAVVLRECLGRLPVKQRRVVYLRFYCGESLGAIASLTGCPLGTVKSRLFNGLDRLARTKALQLFMNDETLP